MANPPSPANPIQGKLAAAAQVMLTRSASGSSETLYQDERRQLENESLKIENRRLQDDLTRARAIHVFRIIMMSALFLLTLAWLAAVVCAVWLSARYGNDAYTATKPSYSFKLPDSVLVAFISSTTVSVLGIFIIAAKWLFPSSNEKDKKTKE